MYYYKTTVRLNGNTQNEVVKIVSAPEFLVLQYVHGVDALVNPIEIKQAPVKMIEEKQRLKGLYEMALIKREQSIDRIFGALGSLPDRLPTELLERFGMLDDIDEDDVLTIARQSSKAKTVKTNQPQSQLELDRQEGILSPQEVNVADLME